MILLYILVQTQSVPSLYAKLSKADNSGSMKFEENGERIEDLRLVLSRVAYAATLFDDDGISLRFMNRPPGGGPQLDEIRNEQQITNLIGQRGQEGQIKFQGLTPLGTQLREQVVDPLIVRKPGGLKKPVLVITITDGQPAGEPRGTLKQTIQYTLGEMARYPQYGRKPVSFMFAQVGNDRAAQDFLAELDVDPSVGKNVDCVSNFENEQDEFMRKTGRDLTPDLWVLISPFFLSTLNIANHLRT